MLKTSPHLRWKIALLISAAIAISYLDRQTLPVAVTAIARDIPLSNQRFYRLLWRRGGPGLAATGFLLHLLYFLYSATSFALVWLDMRLRGAGRALGHRRSGLR